MTFEQAVNALLEGKVIYRQSWENDVIVPPKMARDFNLTWEGCPLEVRLTPCRSGVLYRIWKITQEELDAEDWETAGPFRYRIDFRRFTKPRKVKAGKG